jgi:hypothetical protein
VEDVGVDHRGADVPVSERLVEDRLVEVMAAPSGDPVHVVIRLPTPPPAAGLISRQ